MTRVAPSITNFLQIKDVTPAIAKRIRAIWKADKLDDLYALYPESREKTIDRVNEYTVGRGSPARLYRALLRALIDEELGTSGVEFLGVHRRSGEDVYYCNAGDSYATTVLFVGNSLRVGCCGDYVEANAVRDPNDY